MPNQVNLVKKKGGILELREIDLLLGYVSRKLPYVIGSHRSHLVEMYFVRLLNSEKALQLSPAQNEVIKAINGSDRSLPMKGLSLARIIFPDSKWTDEDYDPWHELLEEMLRQAVPDRYQAQFNEMRYLISPLMEFCWQVFLSNTNSIRLTHQKRIILEKTFKTSWLAEAWLVAREIDPSFIRGYRTQREDGYHVLYINSANETFSLAGRPI